MYIYIYIERERDRERDVYIRRLRRESTPEKRTASDDELQERQIGGVRERFLPLAFKRIGGWISQGSKSGGKGPHMDFKGSKSGGWRAVPAAGFPGKASQKKKGAFRRGRERAAYAPCTGICPCCRIG